MKIFDRLVLLEFSKELTELICKTSDVMVLRS